MNIPFINAELVAKSLDYEKLISSLQHAFKVNKINTPTRHHHEFNTTSNGLPSTLLLMPSWLDNKDLGVKMVTVSPENAKLNLPAINGIYTLIDGVTGMPKLLLDAKELTVKRTAATSALASSYLSNPTSSTMLMIGTGALSPELIKAHAKVRPIEKVLVWGRSKAKADHVVKLLQDQPFEIETVSTIEEGMKKVEIISCATLSAEPLVLGKHLNSGQHIDLVGSYKPNMREADNTTIHKSNVYIDSEAAIYESGDLVLPLKEEVIKKTDLKGDLFDLTSDKCIGRTKSDEITFFKSVGHALEDLVAAQLVFEHITKPNN